MIATKPDPNTIIGSPQANRARLLDTTLKFRSLCILQDGLDTLMFGTNWKHLKVPPQGIM